MIERVPVIELGELTMRRAASLRARLSVNAAGAVTGVEIMSSNPPRVFDRSVSTALAQWKYEATGEASSKLVEVSFQR